jgi:hemolysin activation/secretion protein
MQHPIGDNNVFEGHQKSVRQKNGIYGGQKMLRVNKNTQSLLVIAIAVLVAGLYLPVLAARMPVSETEEQQVLEDKRTQEAAVTADKSVPSAEQVALDAVPEDTTPRFMLSQIVFSGNTVFTDKQFLAKIPDTYETSAGAVDLTGLKSIAQEPGTEHDVSAQSIQGFTQYILSIYQDKHYAGIYVYVPAAAFELNGDLSQGILPIRILEASVSDVSSAYFDPNNQPAEKQYLNPDALLGWSPVQEDQTINRKELDDYINLLNLNPDRYVSATVSKGAEPNSLAVQYNVYEANPWHYFVQVDNSGTDDIQWRPRFGLINTNLLGYDDKFTAVYQTTPDKTWDEDYAIFGAYDFPIMGPKLRLNLFAGYSQFDIEDPDVDFFRGNGWFTGGQLRYNAYQFDDWFWDVTGTIQYEESKVSNDLYNLYKALFGIDLNTNIHMTLWAAGTELYKTTDMTQSFFGFEWFGTISTSDQDKMNLARPGGADDNFNIYYLNARHSRYLDDDKIQRLTGSARYIGTDDRLVQSKMTSFGGMYTIRGYEEVDTIADKGLIASVQYEYDLIRAGQVALFGEDVDDTKRKPFLKKLAPLAFFDYGRAEYNDALLLEDDTDLYSVGGGLITELGDNFTGTVYYGYPLKETNDTGRGQGRLHAGLLFRW